MGRRRCCCAEDCIIYYDDFNRAEIGPNWHVCSGNWSIVSTAQGTRLREEGTPGALILLNVPHPILNSASSVARVKTFNGKTGARHRVYLNMADGCSANYSHEYALLPGGPEHSIRNGGGAATDQQDTGDTPPFSCIPDRDNNLDEYLAEAGTLTSPTSPGEQTIYLTKSVWSTSTPLVVLISHSGRSAEGITTGAAQGFGVAVSDESRAAVCVWSEDNVDTSNAGRGHDNTKCVLFLDSTGTVEAADFVEFLPGDDPMADPGFKLNWTTASATGYKYNYLVLGGDFLKSVHLKQIQSPTAPGVVNYTGVGFKPDALVGFTAGLSSAPPATGDDMQLCLGLAADEYSAHSIYAEDGADTTNAARQQVEAFLSTINSVTVLDECVPNGFTNDGYSLNWTTADSTQRYCWILAIEGPDARVVTDTFKSTTGEKTTNVGFVGQAAILGSIMEPTTASIENDARLCIGFIDKQDGQACSGSLDEDGVDTSNTSRCQHNSRVLEVYDHADTLQGAAVGDLIDDDLVMDRTVAADSVEYEWAALVLGQPVGAGGQEFTICNSQSGFAGYGIGCINTKVWDEDYEPVVGNRWMALGNASSKPVEFDWISYEMHWEDDPTCRKCHCACYHGDTDRKMPPKTLIATIAAYDGCAGTCMDGLEVELVYSLVDDSWTGTNTCECEGGTFVANVYLECGDYPLDVTDWTIDQVGTCNVFETTPNADESSTCDPIYLVFGPFQVPGGDLACPCCGFVSEAGYYYLVVTEP